MTDNKNKPVLKQKIGRVHLSLFENTSERGPWYSLSVDRVYKDAEGFKRVSSFPEEELENLKLAIDIAQRHIASTRSE